MTTPPFPNLEHVPANLLPRIAPMRPYTVVVFRKGPAYDGADTMRVVQAEHLPYLFELRDRGHVLLSMPAAGGDHYLAVAVFNESDPAEVERLMAADPSIQKGVFVADYVPVMGIPGDALIA